MTLKTKVMQAVLVSLMLTLILIMVFLTAYGVALLTLVSLWNGILTGRFQRETS